jgi:hypothetical protein
MSLLAQPYLVTSAFARGTGPRSVSADLLCGSAAARSAAVVRPVSQSLDLAVRRAGVLSGRRVLAGRPLLATTESRNLT